MKHNTLNFLLPSSGASRRIRVLLWSVVFASLSGCATYPQTKIQTVTTAELVPVDESQTTQQKGGVRLRDTGNVPVTNLTQAVKIQQCSGNRLRTYPRKIKDGYGNVIRVEYEPVYETVNPLEGAYVRRFEISNNTEHSLRLSSMFIVITDSSGEDVHAYTKDELKSHIRSRWPCSSGNTLLHTLAPIKILGPNVKLLPGRTWKGYAIFPGQQRKISTLGGDWFVQYGDVPVKTNAAGEVSKRTSFSYDLRVKRVRTTTEYTKASLLAPWQVGDSKTEELSD